MTEFEIDTGVKNKGHRGYGPTGTASPASFLNSNSAFFANSAVSADSAISARYEIPFLNVSTSAAETETFTGFGLLPPLAARSGPTPRAPPEADTSADCFSGAAVCLRFASETPFL